MSLDKNLELLHKTLHAANVDNEDVHTYLDWVGDHIQFQARLWFVRVLYVGATMLVLGILSGWVFCKGIA